MAGVSITVGENPETARPLADSAPFHGPPRPVPDRGREKADALRRPQAAVLYRALRERLDGMSWAECWALGEGEESWAVGPIVIWLRSKGVAVVAEYDTSLGETRFFLPVL